LVTKYHLFNINEQYKNSPALLFIFGKKSCPVHLVDIKGQVISERNFGVLNVPLFFI
jgi:hypothetical protein